jgi:hypothetical protein
LRVTTPNEVADQLEASWYSSPRPSTYVKPELKDRLRLLIDKITEATAETVDK